MRSGEGRRLSSEEVAAAASAMAARLPMLMLLFKML